MERLENTKIVTRMEQVITELVCGSSIKIITEIEIYKVDDIKCPSDLMH